MHRPAPAVTVLFVRHAYAGDRDQWDGDDRLRPIRGKGIRQAEGLVGLLSGYDISRVFSSPYARCMQTVEPLAASLGLRVEAVEALGEGRGADGLSLLDGATGVTVLCGHGDNIPDMLDAIGVDNDGCRKGAAWVVVPGKPPQYLPPSD